MHKKTICSDKILCSTHAPIPKGWDSFGVIFNCTMYHHKRYALAFSVDKSLITTTVHHSSILKLYVHSFPFRYVTNYLPRSGRTLFVALDCKLLLSTVTTILRVTRSFTFNQLSPFLNTFYYEFPFVIVG